MYDKGKLIAVIDEGTKIARVVIFKSKPHFEELCSHEIEIEQIHPQNRWVEQDPLTILDAVDKCSAEAIRKLDNFIPSIYSKSDIAAVGITNQRETVVIWDKQTGKPLHNAIVWNDARTEETVEKVLDKIPNRDKNHCKLVSGLPISPYFSALKIMWLKENVPAINEAFKNKTCLVGTIDSWLVWNLTGGPNGGLHITDVTNASRTLLMNLETLQWDAELLKTFSIDVDALPEIHSSSEVFGKISNGSTLDSIPICGIMGNQQSSLIGQMCYEKGQTKVTYRNACFLMCNTGEERVFSKEGLVTTVAYKMGKNQPTIYALEGSVAVGGTALQWLGNKLGLLKSHENSELLASSVFSTGDVYFVPAINGLYAPSWKSDAKGIICGLTAFTTRNHIIRAALESICFQTHDILKALESCLGMKLRKLNVDGPMSKNNLLMQLQADLSGLPVLRTKVHDTTALGVALVAAHSTDMEVFCLQNDFGDSLGTNKIVPTYDIFHSLTSAEDRDKRYKKWKMAVDRSSHSYEIQS
ncbi:glycerol kinase-like isoform X2 [Sitodiplosis mosellana]|nr:glycerol kinase-like isoform X2 [Sitodiplosis mosellana]XP_055314074.1 glycerol kinase-like isoform X2 [Sitodiplosis mosellana]XP_055314075.1 glycerol kinase-like isoform X2 [Sitodiplosis mosellana]XP_055314076.1 glycerol kinase-like isoform X2 [Sitodiplosis mosellana]XP_055314077.1 glycerol kinase-like isoform X2 [Sitodiplosis mosellana]